MIDVNKRIFLDIQENDKELCNNINSNIVEKNMKKEKKCSNSVEEIQEGVEIENDKEKEGEWKLAVNECDKFMNPIGNAESSFCYRQGYYEVHLSSKLRNIRIFIYVTFCF